MKNEAILRTYRTRGEYRHQLFRLKRPGAFGVRRFSAAFVFAFPKGQKRKTKAAEKRRSPKKGTIRLEGYTVDSTLACPENWGVWRNGRRNLPRADGMGQTTG